MNEGHSFLTEQQIAQELAQDRTILKFILSRFPDRLSAEIHENRKVYDRKLLPLFIFINEKLNSGMTPTEINDAIDGRFNKKDGSSPPPSGNTAGTGTMEELFRQLSQDREKLAKAQEKRTEVEERKAAAMEKRAEAEKQKAEAMNHIAMALQGMRDQARGPEQPAELAEKTAAAVTSSEEAQEPDDLLSLIDEIPEEPEGKEETPAEQQDTDDLSDLIRDLEPGESADSPLDEDDVNDLADLLDEEPREAETPEKTALDDLSMLIDRADEAAFRTDDLSLLIEETELDDLSLLVEDEERNSLTPDISPDEDFEAYKQAIINIVIELKQQGLTPEDTCERFNKEGVRTLSGKSRWSVKTINGIYRFIDSAA